MVNQPPNANFSGCALDGISLSGDRHLANLGMDYWDTIQVWSGWVNTNYRIHSDRVHCHLGVALYAMEVGQEACRRRASVRISLSELQWLQGKRLTWIG